MDTMNVCTSQLIILAATHFPRHTLPIALQEKPDNPSHGRISIERGTLVIHNSHRQFLDNIHCRRFA